MKIAFFTDTYYPQINGVVKSIDIFCKQLRKLGNEVHIFCPDGVKRSKYIHPIHSTEFQSYPEYRVGLPSINIMKEFKKINPDVVHLHSPFTIGFVGMSLSKIFKIPTVSTHHTLLSDYFEYANSSKYNKKIADDYVNYFFSRSSIVIVPSNPIKNLLKIKTTIKVLPTPLDIKIVKNKRKNKALTILHVGRLCKEKRIDIILKAFVRIHKKIKSRLIITSDGPDRKRLENFCKKFGIENDVTFTGYVSDRMISKLYSTADIFVSASDTETQGLVILEAMANGCPVIARNALGFKDFVENRKNGILFDTENELVKNIQLIKKDNKLRSKLIKNGYETVRRFNISNYAKKIEDVYKESFDRKIDSKTIWKMFYATFFLFGSLEFWILKKMKIPINSRLLGLHIRFFKMFSIFERLRSFI
jgi:1,2-diacylglycerol 3-alpha-glucosyltransferase